MNDPTLSELLDLALAAERAGQFDEAREKLRTVLASAGGTMALDVRLCLGRLCVLGGHELLDEAEQVLSQARDQAQAAGSPRQEATAIHLLALLERGRGNIEQAQQTLAESPAGGLKLSPPGPETAQWFHYRGLFAADRGERSFAERQFFRAHQLYGEADHQPGIAEVCDSLAGHLLKQGKTKSELLFCRRSLEVKRKLQDRFGEAITLGTMGRIYEQQARYDEAREAFADDLELSRELNDHRGIGIMLNSLGQVAWLQGELDAALDYYRQSIRENQSPLNQAHAYLGIARVQVAANQFDAAREAMSRMAPLLNQTHNPPGLVAAREGLEGALAWRHGDLEEGERLLRQTIVSLQELGLSLDTLPLLYELRDLHQKRGDISKAATVMCDALDLLSECGAERGVKDVEEWLRTVDNPGLTRLALERHFPKELVEQVLSGQLNLPKPRTQNVAILFTDVRGYTTMSEGLAPEVVVELLNEWFSEATRAIQRHGGMVDKFIGDAVMALFRAPQPREDAAADAVRAALEMREALSAMNLRQEALGGKQLKVGIGIDTGDVVVGFIGSHLRQSYTVLGDPVNTASRLEGATKNYPGCDILISQATEDVQQRYNVAETKFLGNAELKGKHHRVPVYQVRGLAR